MIQLDAEKVRRYLEARFGASVGILGLSVLGQESGAGELKGYGYGVPVKVDYELSGQRHAAVLETVTPGPFGHEHMADRAQILLWSHAAFNRLPRHVRSLDVGGFSKEGSLVSRTVFRVSRARCCQSLVVSEARPRDPREAAALRPRGTRPPEIRSIVH
jgi:hypothetical protein